MTFTTMMEKSFIVHNGEYEEYIDVMSAMEIDMGIK